MKTLAGSMHVLETVCRMHGGREGAGCPLGWLLRWAGRWATKAQLEAEVGVRRLEEGLSLEKGMWCHCSAGFRAGRQGMGWTL